MAIFDLFSKRQKAFRGEVPDVYSYDNIPEKLRVQIVHIVRDAIGPYSQHSGRKAYECYEIIHNALCREYGKFSLTKHQRPPDESIFEFFLSTANYEEALDFIELSFKVIDAFASFDEYQYNVQTKIRPADAIEELNERFKEHGIGYHFESTKLIRIDSQFIHSEVVKPVLALLSDAQFKTANDEFLAAHTHYRHGRNKECINESLKAFESVLKIICGIHKWPYQQNATSKTLIEICLSNQLVPSYLQSQLTSLRSLIESGVPTIRNRVGGHGQGEAPINAEDHLASYMLHLTASNIVFFIECSKLI